jgi:hypothetical protein
MMHPERDYPIGACDGASLLAVQSERCTLIYIDGCESLVLLSVRARTSLEAAAHKCIYACGIDR